jgi:hypothetical protein
MCLRRGVSEEPSWGKKPSAQRERKCERNVDDHSPPVEPGHPFILLLLRDDALVKRLVVRVLELGLGVSAVWRVDRRSWRNRRVSGGTGMDITWAMDRQFWSFRTTRAGSPTPATLVLSLAPALPRNQTHGPAHSYPAIDTAPHTYTLIQPIPPIPPIPPPTIPESRRPENHTIPATLTLSRPSYVPGTLPFPISCTCGWCGIVLRSGWRIEAFSLPVLLLPWP